MAQRTFERKENKYIITHSQYAELLPKLLEYMNYDEYCQNGSYSIYNIYYDTAGNDVIRHSLSKPYYKEKLRLRSYYVPSSPEDKVYLELKKKIGGIVSKRRATMTLGEAYRFISDGIKPGAVKYLDRQVIDEISYYLTNTRVKPAVYLSYDRVAFFGKEDSNFRLTLDTNIQTRRTDLFLEGGAYGKQLLGEGMYIMEVKVTRGIPLWLAKEFSRLGIARTSFSKYGTEYKQFTLRENEKIKA